MKNPPKWMTRFFQWFCNDDLCEAIEGDLLTIYNDRLSRMSRFKANILYFIQVLTFIQPFAMRKKSNSSLLQSSMLFFNNLKVGIRLIRKNTTYSSINIFGLAFGLSAVILITLFVRYELSFDRFHKNGDNIARLTYRLETPSATRLGAKLPFPVKEVLQSDYPEVIRTARIYHWGSDTPLLAYGDKKYTEEGIYFAESDVFKVFDFEFIAGDPQTALAEPRSIILTESMVARYFGDENPMGKIMKYKNEDDLIVTGIMKNILPNSHISFDVLVPIELQRQRWMGWGKYTYDLEKDWNWAAAWTYAQLTPDTNLSEFESKLQTIAQEHFNTEQQDGFSIEVQPLHDIHLHSKKSGEAKSNGNLNQVYAFGIVGILILFIACINFVNLTSAQTNERLKEIGLRKVMGARRRQLVSQFMTESSVLIIIASSLAITIAYITLPLFNTFMNSSLSIGSKEAPLIAISLLIALNLALISGVRPSMAVIRLKVTERFSMLKSKHRFSKMMIIGQFVVCNLLLVGIIVVNQQLSYLQNKELGFDKEHILMLRHARNMTKNQYEVFDNELKSVPSVKNMYRGYVAGTSSYTNTFKRVGGEDETTYSLGIKWIGDGFTEMFDLKIVEGRVLDPDLSYDRTSGILINESTADVMGWEINESIGKKLSFLPGGETEPQIIEVIGVLEDANFESLYDPVQPSIFRMPSSSVGSEVSLKLSGTNDLLETLDQIERLWNKVIPDWPFEVSFLDEKIQEHYQKEKRLAQAISYFTLLAILIACSGLFGLASFAVQRRSKEIGVRKVMGASIQNIFMLVSKRFLLLIGVSFILSVPLGYYFTNEWLQNFAYRVEVGPEVFLLSAAFSLIMVLLAIGSQSLKAAKSDPVNTLRYE